MMRLPATTMLTLLGALAASAWASAGELVLFTWEEYLDPAIIEEFHQTTGIRIHTKFYDTDESKGEILAATNGGKGFDLLIGSGYSLQVMKQTGWLEPLPESRLANLKHLDPKWRKHYPQLREYAIPYFWGTVGLAYRTDLVSKPESWMDFFRPAPAVRGKLLLINDSKDAVGMALKAQNYNVNSDNPKELKAASDLLDGLKPFLRAIGYFDLTEDSAFATGELVMAMGYSGDVLSLQEHVPEVSYVVPREGSNLWIDYIAVLAASQHKEEAFRFINFLNEPEVAARNAKYVYYATPNKSAEQYLDQDFLAHPILYPPSEVLDRSETYEAMSLQGTRSRTRIWARYSE